MLKELTTACTGSPIKLAPGDAERRWPKRKETNTLGKVKATSPYARGDSMPHFTCITEIHESIELSQVQTETPDSALRRAISMLPFDDCAGPFGEELDWLQEVASGSAPVTMHPVGHCKNTWLWMEGARNEPQYLTYIIKTDLS